MLKRCFKTLFSIRSIKQDCADFAITHSGEPSQDNTERRILCNPKMSTLLRITTSS
jgi:hypothetical protein